jgi:DNA-binding MarR family transcriptional regulator
MNDDPNDVAAALLASVSLLLRRMRHIKVPGALKIQERTALSRLDRGGPATSAELARQEQISPQSMGAILGALEKRGLIERSADPNDGRRIVLSLTRAGRQVVQDKRNEQAERIARALESDFTRAERRQLAAAAPLLERLAQRI